MNKFVFAPAVLGIFALVGAQSVTNYRNADDSVEMSFKQIQMKTLSRTSTRIILKGGVEVKSFKQGIDIVADHATTFLTTEEKTTSLKSVHAVGKVKMNKHSLGKGDIRTSSILSDVADYEDGSPHPHADFQGSVELTDQNSTKKSVVHAFGDTGHATFTGPIDAKNSTLAQAVLTGSVVIHVDQAPVANSKPGTLTAHCSRLEYTPTANISTLILSGGVKIEGTQGVMNGTLNHVNKMTIHLDSKKQVTDVDTGNID